VQRKIDASGKYTVVALALGRLYFLAAKHGGFGYDLASMGGHQEFRLSPINGS
jgi:hypothetical protein